MSRRTSLCVASPLGLLCFCSMPLATSGGGTDTYRTLRARRSLCYSSTTLRFPLAVVDESTRSVADRGAVQVQAAVDAICTEVVELVDKTLIPRSSNAESAAFYNKMYVRPVVVRVFLLSRLVCVCDDSLFLSELQTSCGTAARHRRYVMRCSCPREVTNGSYNVARFHRGRVWKRTLRNDTTKH